MEWKLSIYYLFQSPKLVSPINSELWDDKAWSSNPLDPNQERTAHSSIYVWVIIITHPRLVAFSTH